MGSKSTDDPFYQELGKELKKAREAKGMSPVSVASALGHSHSNAITRYENATRTPDVKTFARLSVIYDVPVNSMIAQASTAASRAIQIIGEKSVKENKK